MSAFLSILEVTFPFFALIAAGYVATRLRLLPLESIPGLNAFVLYVALPCMLYRFAATTPIVRLLDAGTSTTWLACAVTMVALAVATARRFGRRWDDASFGALVVAFPNAGFLGVPRLVALFGPRASAPVIVAITIDQIVTTSLCIGLSQLDDRDGQRAARTTLQALKGVAKNPLPWAIALGCVATATGLEAKPPLSGVIDMLALAAAPVALFTIGCVLARPTSAATPSRQARDVGVMALYKLVVHPALVYAVGLVARRIGLPLDDFTLSVLVVLAALPSASSVTMLAERFGADATRVARIILVTTIVSFFTFAWTVTLFA